MRASEKFSVPNELAILYDFVNSLDLRTYVEDGAPHIASDAFGTVADFSIWMIDHDLATGPQSTADLARAVALRSALRDILQTAPDCRTDVIERLNQCAEDLPLIVRIEGNGAVCMQPQKGASALGLVLAQLYDVAAAGNLHRLKTCPSDQCGWVFFDRSKPGNRRWCSSTLCGNREKTRAYRERQATI